MRMSLLQKYILRTLVAYGMRIVPRIEFIKFYNKQQPVEAVNIVTKSLENLIDKEFLVGYGVRTPHKWYIKEVRLTPKGRQVARRLMGEQQRLPLKMKIKNPKS